MNRYLVLTVTLALAGAAVLTGSPARASTQAGHTGAGGGWGTAEEVPGTAALNSAGQAVINSVSCASAGNCSAGGSYFGRGGTQPFVVSQVHGTWRKAEKVPGIAKLNGFGWAEITSVSCVSAGNCSAGGYYLTGETGSEQEPFVVSQVHGTWGKAKEVPGITRLNTFGGVATFDSVSCGSAGNCSAGGSYVDNSGNAQAYVVSQVNGTWGKAKEVPGTATLNPVDAGVNSVSCGSAGHCSAGGFYVGHSGNATHAFVVNRVGGTWRKAEKVPGTAGRGSDLDSVSCASAGNCSAGGSYTARRGHVQAFVISRT